MNIYLGLFQWFVTHFRPFPILVFLKFLHIQNLTAIHVKEA